MKVTVRLKDTFNFISVKIPDTKDAEKIKDKVGQKLNCKEYRDKVRRAGGFEVLSVRR